MCCYDDYYDMLHVKNRETILSRIQWMVNCTEMQNVFQNIVVSSHTFEFY